MTKGTSGIIVTAGALGRVFAAGFATGVIVTFVLLALTVRS